jgi:hypothetical protein
MIVVALLTINTNYPHLTLTLHFLRKRLLIRFVMVGVLVLRLSTVVPALAALWQPSICHLNGMFPKWLLKSIGCLSPLLTINTN